MFKLPHVGPLTVAAILTLAATAPAVAQTRAETTAATVQRLADESDLRNLIYHYGRGGAGTTLYIRFRSLVFALSGACAG
jgi:hypothetical protein